MLDIVLRSVTIGDKPEDESEYKHFADDPDMGKYMRYIYIWFNLYPVKWPPDDFLAITSL